MEKDFKLIGDLNYSEGGIISKVLFKGEKNQITLFSMAKGTEISEHATTKEGFVYVIEGEGIFNLQSVKIDMKPRVLIPLAKGTKHSLSVSGNTSFLLFLNM